MYKLGILSRDAETYATLIKQANLQDLQVRFYHQHSAPQTELSQLDILLAEPKLAAQVLMQCTKLQWLQSTWAGNKPVFDLPRRDYLFSGVKDVFQDAMAEYVFAYMLYFSRNIAGFKQQQQQALWQSPGFSSLKGKTLGIIGVGNIGKGVAAKARAFGLQVKGLSRSSRDCNDVDEYFSWAQLPEFCCDLDYLVCLLPHSLSTEGLIDAALLALLPDYCVLINAGRGQTLVEADLLVALQKKSLKAAVLDVFAHEPLDTSHPFWHMDNVYITQHTAAESKPQDIARIFIQNYALFTRGQALHGQLDFSQAY